ncbi:hypothetical protein QJS04_geneDACA020502 [Acorus gramineus]|uniref:Uncharacterized protein n=1 Tax=Acorus gramineus TaxID=55184 RepID=A0AAV9AB58_ACOGR|nr:hypothetical protein QJS04_geneDACA020502 [Acorus gramineus]
MATAWVRSLSCKSRASHDVYDPIINSIPTNSPFKSISACTASSKTLLDVIPTTHHKTKPTNKNPPEKQPEPPPVPAPTRPGPNLSSLPNGNSSREVVEIIFRSSWSSKGPFPGTIDMLFKVHSTARTAARFEEFRDSVRARSGSRCTARCAADGNEVLRFHCPRPASARIYDSSVLCSFSSAVRTFSGSGAAHDRAGCGRGRNAMLVCRVIAGRVRDESCSPGSGRFDSVRGEKGELVVLDPRAVLPCFLIIYKV